MARQGAAARGTRRRGWVSRLARALLIAAAAFVLLSGAAVLALRWIPPVTTAFMLDARLDAWRAGEKDYRTRYSWVPFDRISGHAGIAVIAAEDQRFADHGGFDFKAIGEAAKRNASGKRIRGASTISQQVAKNVFLWSGRSWVRKGIEVWFTLLIETLWPKQRILEVYLNVAEFGRGVYGVEAASQRFFRKPAASLTRREAATLAAVLPSPRRFRADAPSRYVAARRDWIMGQMSALGGRSHLQRLDQDRS